MIVQKKRKCSNRCGKEAKFMAALSAVCSIECAAELAHKKLKKKKVSERKEFKKAKRKLDENDLSKQKSLTQNAFNKLRRLECIKWFKDQGRDPECISCGKKSGDWCCGHYKTVGSTGNLRYDKDNTHLQCNTYCNRNLSGNINGNRNTRGYTRGLYEVYGDEEAERILAKLEEEQHKVKRWTCEELIQMRKEINARIREIEAQE